MAPQLAFFNEFEGKKPPDECEKGGHDPAKTKAELIKYFKDSFDDSNGVLATLTAKNALERVEGRYVDRTPNLVPPSSPSGTSPTTTDNWSSTCA